MEVRKLAYSLEDRSTRSGCELIVIHTEPCNRMSNIHLQIMSYIIQASIENKSTEKDMPYLSGDAAAMIIAGRYKRHTVVCVVLTRLMCRLVQ